MVLVWAVDQEGIPFICGGGQNRGFEENPEYFDECYKYVPEADSWEVQGTMPYKAGFMSDVQE